MKYSNPSGTQRAQALLAAASLLVLTCAWWTPESGAAAGQDAAPDASPVIGQLRPAEATPGAQVDVEIDGANFARDAYVSCSSPQVHVVKVKRANAARIDAKLAILPKAQPGTVTLYVSNPAGSVAQATFTITGAGSPPGGTAVSASTSRAPAAGQQEATTGPGSPEVASVEPSSVTPGSQLVVKIKGKNFAQGASASFSNPGIRVVETKVEKSSQLAVQIQVASEAAAGTGSVYVVNPDDTEAEARFDVTSGSPVATATDGSTQPATPTSAGSTTTTPAPGTGTSSGTSKSARQQFEVYNLAGILGGGSKTQGTLTLASGKLKYLEGDTEVFAAARKEIREIGVNSFLGVNTGTFHIILNSGKTYNFIASSLRPADSQSIVDALRAALR